MEEKDDYVLPELFSSYTLRKEFSWDRHLELSGVQASDSADLFKHVFDANRSVLEVLLSKATHLVLSPNERRGRQICRKLECTGTAVLVCPHDAIDDSLDFWLDETTEIGCKSVDKEAAEAFIKESPKARAGFIFPNFDNLERYKLFWEDDVSQMIKPRTVFLLRAENDRYQELPVRVVTYSGGFIQYEQCGSKKDRNKPKTPGPDDAQSSVQKGYVYLLNPICRAMTRLEYLKYCLKKKGSADQPIELAESDDENGEDSIPITLSPEMEAEFQAETVPAFVFENNRIEPHFLTVGTMVEVQGFLDPSAIYPGYVRQVVDKYKIAVYTTEFSLKRLLPENYRRYTENPFVANIRSERIFPIGYAAQIGIKMTPPYFWKKGNDFFDRNETAWKHFAINGLDPEGLDSMMQNVVWKRSTFAQFHGYERIKKKSELSGIATMQYVEAQLDDRATLRPAVISRVYDKKASTVFLRFCSHDRPYYEKAIPLRIGSCRIFPCGFADSHNLPLIPTRPFLTLPHLLGGQKTRKFGRRRYASAPGPVFSEPKNGRGGRSYAYMPHIYLKEDIMLPRLYVHRPCLVSSNLHPERTNALLPQYYERGVLPDMIRTVVSDILRCASDGGRPRIMASLEMASEGAYRSSSCPPLVMSIKVPREKDKLGRRKMGPRAKPYLNLVVCRTSEQFAGYIRTLLLAIDCCPNMLSFDSRSLCGENNNHPEEDVITLDDDDDDDDDDDELMLDSPSVSETIDADEGMDMRNNPVIRVRTDGRQNASFDCVATNPSTVLNKRYNVDDTYT